MPYHLHGSKSLNYFYKLEAVKKTASIIPLPMRLKFLLFIIALPLSLKAQTFDLFISTPEKDGCFALYELQRGGFLVSNCYLAHINPGFNYSCQILKLNPEGDIIDSMQVNKEGHVASIHGFFPSSHGFYAYGVQFDPFSRQRKPFLLKADEDLTIEFLKTYEVLSPSCYFSNRSIINSKGNFLFITSQNIFETFLTEVDSTGEVIRRSDNFNLTYNKSLIEVKGKYILLNYLHYQYFNENLEWDGVQHKYQEEMFSSDYAKVLTDSTFIVAGCYTWTNSNIAFHVNKPDMTRIATQEYLTPNYPNYHTSGNALDYITKDSIFIGFTRNFNGRYFEDLEKDQWYGLYNVNENGDMNWKRYYGGDAYYLLKTMAPTRDGGAILAGTRLDWRNNFVNGDDIYIIKVDKNGDFTPKAGLSIEQRKANGNKALVYPNPAKDKISFKTNADGLIVVSDLQGRKITTQPLLDGHCEINLSNLPQGIYIYNIQYENSKEWGKFVKE
jgi:hypothetical protein